jgi:hypothetical protein
MAQPQTRPATFDGAQILRVVGSTAGELIVTAHSGPAEPWRVRSALPQDIVVSAGDEVVVLPSSEGPVAIARLRSPASDQRAAPASDQRAAPATHTLEGSIQPLRDGTRVHADATSITVERADGTPLFRYSAEPGRGTVTLSAEALHLAASAGDLTLQAAGEIRMRSRSLSLKSSMPGADAALEIGPRTARLVGRALELAGDTFKLDAAEAELTGGELRSSFKRAVIALERLDSSADVVVSRARNVYQSVQELLQQQAGNLRTLVAGSAQLKAREVSQRADEAYKIRAEKIHLG